MSIETFTITQKAVVTMDANTGTTTKPLLNYTPYTRSGYRVIDERLEVENLKAVSWVYSLPEIAFPVFELEDTESKQLLTAINLEWKSPRIQFDVVFNINNSGNWQKILSYSLLNVSPYPYREYSLGNHSLGNNSMIGFQIKNVGYGLLQNANLGNDKVAIYGDIKRIITIEKIVDTSTKITNNITTNSATIVNSNINRKGLTLFNNSEKIIYIDTVATVSTSSYLAKLDIGDYYEFPSPIYTGNVYAVVASNSTAIDIREYQ